MQGREPSAPLGRPFHARPSLEYQHAFDLCAVEVQRAGGPVQVIAGSPFYARELLKRFDSRTSVLFPAWNPNLSTEELADSLGEEAVWAGLQSGLSARAQAGAVVWAEPEMQDAERFAGEISRALQPGARLCVVASGWLARYLPERQRLVDRPAGHPAGLRRTRYWLRRAGLTIEAAYGFHGPMSMLLGYASGLAGRLRRPDLADRCHFGMRAHFSVSGWQAFWAPVGVLVAARPTRVDGGSDERH